VNEIPQIQDFGCTPGTCPSELELEQFHLGEGDPVSRAALKRSIDNCAGCTGRLAGLSAGFSAFPHLDAVSLGQRILNDFQGVLPNTMSAHVSVEQGDTGPKKGLWSHLFGWLNLPSVRYATIGVAAAVLLSVLMPQMAKNPNEEPGIRMKGQLTLNVQRSRAGQIEPVHSGDQFKAGDRLRFQVLTPKAGHFLILGKESGGRVYVVYPLEREGKSASKPKGRQELAEAVELDETTGTESLYGVFCPHPFARKDVTFDGAKIVTSSTCQTTTFKLIKTP
jgi:hypothetical protein